MTQLTKDQRGTYSEWYVRELKECLRACRTFMCHPAGMTQEIALDKEKLHRFLDEAEQRQTRLIQRITSLINAREEDVRERA